MDRHLEHQPWILDDPAATLPVIIRQGRGRIGSTLVAHVDRETRALMGVRRLRTPEPRFTSESEHWGQVLSPSQDLSDLLGDIAHEMAPPRVRTDAGWSPTAADLFTVVCREGYVVDTAVEWQFVHAWRYAAITSACSDGDVYVVTPDGWTGIMDRRAGLTPTVAQRPRLFAL
ncbi:hypothetical protein GA707_05635 [Nostocoides sp. F2B08]|uniref:hypothetical protein n=1 Tax=Nostocoides sp. F2B08 TaxID=2653936 RepID=UPI00126377B1|nr:hypothetical protein [Tetrasphaera sp. F2B08]KAB7745411.1 hypothetical protein GA707_05635 [Tetrasphaera sp. F2B08]